MYMKMEVTQEMAETVKEGLANSFEAFGRILEALEGHLRDLERLFRALAGSWSVWEAW